MTERNRTTAKASDPKKSVPPSDANKSAEADESEIGEEELERVGGGTSLYNACVTGKHIAKAIIT